MSQFGDNIRRIARTKELKDLIDSLTEKAAIEGARGVAYLSASGLVSFQSRKGEDLSFLEGMGLEGVLEGVTDAVEEAKEQAKEEDRKPNGVRNSVTMKDLIDGDSIPGILELITAATDPRYGQELILKHDGLFEAAEASAAAQGQPNATIAGENGTTMPLAQDYISGYFFLANGASYQTYSAAVEAMRYSSGAQGKMGDWVAWGTNTGSIINPGDSPETKAALIPSGNNSLQSISFVVTNTSYPAPGNDQYFSMSITVGRCDRSAGLGAISGAAVVCAASAPRDSYFPLSHASRLALQLDGLWKTSVNDNSQAGKIYRDGVGTAVVKFAGGTRYAVIEAGKGNTTLIYEVDNTTKQPKTDGYTRIYSRGNLSTEGILLSNGLIGNVNGKGYSTGAYITSVPNSEIILHRTAANANLAVISLEGPKLK